jgi:hypothetical protein
MKGFSMKLENAPLFNLVILASTVSLTMALSSLPIQAETPSTAVKPPNTPVQKTLQKPLPKVLTQAGSLTSQTSNLKTEAKTPQKTLPQIKAVTPATKSTKAIQPDAAVTLSAKDKKALTTPQVTQKLPAPKTETPKAATQKPLVTTKPSAIPANAASIKATAAKTAPDKTITIKPAPQKPELSKLEALNVQPTSLKSTAKSGIAGAAANITPKTDSSKTDPVKTDQAKTMPVGASQVKPAQVPKIEASKPQSKQVNGQINGKPEIKKTELKPEQKPELKEAKKAEPAKSASTTKPAKVPPALVTPTVIVTEESRLPKVSDLLHQVEFDISAYPESKKLSGRLTNADEVVQILNGTKNLLVHMEAIRRGSIDLSESEKQALVQKVHARYFASENDVTKFFDNGYTQMTVLNNKSGLFFLRKANDKLANQFTSLAYALAQADADVNIERSSPANMSFRKLDVTYKMTDAVARDAQSHQPGFWPSFTQALEKLGTIPAFTSFAHKDFSDSYVPFPNDGVLGQGGKVKVVTAESTATDASGKSVAASCQPAISSGQDISVDLTKAFKMMPLRLGIMSPLDKVYFFQTAQASQYRVLAINGSRQVLADFISPQAPYIIEDLEGDGTDELVVRQYLKDKKEPVKVYRYSPVCGFQQDKTVASYFH